MVDGMQKVVLGTSTAAASTSTFYSSTSTLYSSTAMHATITILSNTRLPSYCMYYYYVLCILVQTKCRQSMLDVVL